MHILFPTGVGADNGSRGNQRHENGLTLAELQPRTSSRQQDFRDIGGRGKTKPVLAHFGRKPSAKPDPAKLELPQKSRPSPPPPVLGQSPGEFQGTRRCKPVISDTRAVVFPPVLSLLETRLGAIWPRFWARVVVALVAGVGTWRTSVLTASSLKVRRQRGLDVVVVVMAAIAGASVELRLIEVRIHGHGI